MWYALLKARTGGIFASLIGPKDKDIDINTMKTTCNIAMSDSASEILGKESLRKKPCSTSVTRAKI